MKTLDEIKKDDNRRRDRRDGRGIEETAGGTLTETSFCIRQLEQEKIIKEMIGSWR